MPGLPGEKGESGHVGLMVSLYHYFISSHFSQNLFYTWNGCNISYLLYWVLGTPWTARSHWSSRTNWRTGQIHIDFFISLDLFEVLFRVWKKSFLSSLSSVVVQGPSGRPGMLGQPGGVGEKVNRFSFCMHIV